MTTLITTLIFFFSTFIAALMGMLFKKKIPSNYLDADSNRAITISMGMVVTLTSIVLGLLTATSKSSFDQMDAAVKQTAIQLLTLDRILVHYEGQDAQEIRSRIRHSVKFNFPSTIYKNSNEEEIAQSNFFADMEDLVDQIRRLTPRDSYQQVLFSQALQTSQEIVKSRWVAVTSIGSSISNIHLVILWFWLTVIFFSFGLLSPNHALMIVVHFMVALSTAAAIFLMMELEGPFDGFIHVSGDPMQFVNELLHP